MAAERVARRNFMKSLLRYGQKETRLSTAVLNRLLNDRGLKPSLTNKLNMLLSLYGRKLNGSNNKGSGEGTA